MSGRTAVVFFYMIGCPHCEAMRPAWNNAKKNMKTIHVTEKEARDVDMNDGVQSFPTLIVYKNGKEVKRIEGSREKGSDILKELGLQRRSTHGRRTYRGKRKTRNRTLRNYKALA
jgi:thiol-disulfide isomerase/thioredoxin